jgi:hypothetical protein
MPMEHEKEDINEIKELMDYYKEELNKAIETNKNQIQFKERYLFSAIKYFGMLEDQVKKGLSQKSMELDSLLENISESYIPRIIQCKKYIEESTKRLEEYSAMLKEAREEKDSLSLAGRTSNL